MAKITRASFKSFICKNRDQLMVKVCSSFSGMSDMVEQVGDEFTAACDTDLSYSNTFGISGVWLVGHSRDRFHEYSGNGFRGISVYNCCGSFIIAIKEV